MSDKRGGGMRGKKIVSVKVREEVRVMKEVRRRCVIT